MVEIAGLAPVEVLIPAERIRQRVAELGRQLSRTYRGRDLLLVSILKGGIVFLSDLMREITVPHRIDFLSVSSYEEGTESSGRVRLLHDLTEDVAGRHVVLVEDIVDTGRTLAYLIETLRLRQPASLKVCTLVRKLVAAPIQAHPDLIGFELPDRYVVGYGMDLGGHYRHLKCIGAVQDGTMST